MEIELKQSMTMPTLVELIEFPFNKVSLKAIFGDETPRIGVESLVNPSLLDAYRNRTFV